MIASISLSVRRLLREPLVHFFVLGLLLFVLYSVVSQESSVPLGEILIDDFRVDALRAEHERRWQRPPTAQELEALIANWLREEVLYREGLALGFDQNDPLIRRRVAQKVSFMVDDLVAAPVTDEELQAWLEANADKYDIEASYSFRQVFLDPARHAGSLDAVLQETLAALNAGTDPAVLGDQTLLQTSMSDASFSAVSREFGEQFATALAGIDIGKWSGPVRSTFGVHLVHIDSASPARAAMLDEVRADVERDIAFAARQGADDAVYNSLRKRYSIRVETEALPGLADRLAAASP